MAKTLSPEERVLRAQLAAHKLHGSRDSRELTKSARAAFLSKFELEVDPEGKLPPDERHRRAEHAKKAHFYAMALQSARARREKATRSTRARGKGKAAIDLAAGTEVE
jgi:hypothetical protein